MPNSNRHDRTARRGGRLLFAGVLATVLWAPLAFGSVEPWAVGLLRVAALALLALWAIGSAMRGAFAIPSSPLQLVVYAAAGLALVQSLPLFGAAPISVDPFSTWQTAATLFAFGVFFTVALAALDSRRRIEIAAWTVFVFGFGLCLFAIVQRLAGATAIYWFRYTSINTFFGPFVNKNHFAGLLELLLPIGVGLLVAGAVPRERRLLVAFAAAVMGVAMVFSGSRGGLLSIAASLALLGLLALATSSWRGVARAKLAAAGVVGGLAIAGAVLGGVFWLGGDAVVQNLERLPEDIAATDDTSRRAIWSATVSLISERPVAGSGIGAYGTAIVPHWPMNERATLLQAHNDYLQVVSDAGIFGAALAILFVVGLGTHLAQGLRNNDRITRGTALGAGAGIFGLLVHGLVDFNMQIPSNALMFLFTSALLVRASSMRESLESKALIHTHTNELQEREIHV